MLPSLLPVRGRRLKWYKHLTDSLSDPFIQDLIIKFGPNGYLVFFGTLEVYAREFKTDNEWKLDVSTEYLWRKLRVYHKNKLESILRYIDDSGKWDVNFNHDRMTVYIPKFRYLLDEYTIRKMRDAEKKSGHSTDTGTDTHRKTSPLDLDLEEEKEKDFDVTRTITRESPTMKIETGAEPLESIIKRIIPQHPWEEE